jgi:hypothetical protein
VVYSVLIGSILCGSFVDMEKSHFNSLNTPYQDSITRRFSLDVRLSPYIKWDL